MLSGRRTHTHTRTCAHTYTHTLCRRKPIVRGGDRWRGQAMSEEVKQKQAEDCFLSLSILRCETLLVSALRQGTTFKLGEKTLLLATISSCCASANVSYKIMQLKNLMVPFGDEIYSRSVTFYFLLNYIHTVSTLICTWCLPLFIITKLEKWKNLIEINFSGLDHCVILHINQETL